jgi:predicted PurR-regulated permease PerM
MKRLSPLLKGVITAALMLAFTLYLHYAKVPETSGLSYILYSIYGAGIIWTLLTYSRSEGYTGKFKDIFAQGFRCFIIVTLIMVVFTGIFYMMHPEIAEEIKSYKKEQINKVKGKTLPDIEKKIAETQNRIDSFKKQNEKVPSDIDSLMAEAEYEKEIVTLIKDKTPEQIEQALEDEKKYYTPRVIYSSVFGYLILGALFTVAGAAGLLLIRRKA